MDIILTLTSFEMQVVWFAVIFIATTTAIFFAIRSLALPLAWRKKLLFGGAAFGLFILFIFAAKSLTENLTAVPTIESTSPKASGMLNPNAPSITVTFKTPINYDVLDVNVYPDNELNIVSDGYFDGKYGRTLTITPKTSFPPDATVILYFSNVDGPLTAGFYGGEHRLEFTTPQLPQIASIDPPFDAVEIPVDTTFTVTLTSPSTFVSQWSAQLNSPQPVSITQSDDGMKILVAPNEPLSQSKTYTLSLFQTPITTRYEDRQVVKRENPKLAKAIQFATVRPPDIQSFQPQGKSVNPATDIQITFDHGMDTDSVQQAITITPNIAVNFSWQQENTVLTLKHKALAKDTTYTITIPKGVKTANGGFLESDAAFQFKTAGPITLLTSSPTDKSTEIAVGTAIRLTFDQDIKTQSFDKYITFSPAVAYKTSVQGATLELTPDKPLSADMTYTLQLASGLESVYGLPANRQQSISFATAPVQIALAVPFYAQQTLFTCNVAAARMLLAYRGISVTESDLIHYIGLGGKRGSGNPYKGYIDDYGTYWDAIVKGVSHWRTPRLITSGKLSDILAEVAKGNPVMTWGQNGWSDPHEISWTSTDGTYIRAVNGMHSLVVRGFQGSETAPTKILVNDPWRGQYAIDPTVFMARWSYFLMAMVID